MNVTYYYFVTEAFASVKKQVHVHIDGKYYRVFGEGADRYVREVISADKQPKIGKRIAKAILEAMDNYVKLNNRQA